MKILRILLLPGLVLSANAIFAQSASLLGSWQLVGQSTCLETTSSLQDVETDALRTEMTSRSTTAPLTVNFKANSTGTESTRILNSKSVTNKKKFHYKFSGDLLLILDKQSQTISDSYTIDKITADSLIVSSTSRPCEVRIFAKIK